MINGRTKTRIEIFERSGLAEDICGAEGSFKLKYRNMAKYHFSSKHRNYLPKENPSYYRFLRDDVIAILDLNGPHQGRIFLTSKYFFMDEKAVEEFKSAWKIAKSYLRE